jgi:hypothetical protein
MGLSIEGAFSPEEKLQAKFVPVRAVSTDSPLFIVRQSGRRPVLSGRIYFEGGLYVEKKPNFWYCGAVINGAYRLYGVFASHG